MSSMGGPAGRHSAERRAYFVLRGAGRGAPRSCQRRAGDGAGEAQAEAPGRRRAAGAVEGHRSGRHRYVGVQIC